MLLTVLTIIYVVVCLFLIVVVLLQSGKAADLAGAFGGMGSQTAFGPRGAATVLSKATTTSAVLFMVLAIALGVMQGNRGGAGAQSVIERTGVAGEEAPAQAPLPGENVRDIEIPPPPASAPAGEQPEGLEATGVEVEVDPQQ